MANDVSSRLTQVVQFFPDHCDFSLDECVVKLTLTLDSWLTSSLRQTRPRHSISFVPSLRILERKPLEQILESNPWGANLFVDPNC